MAEKKYTWFKLAESIPDLSLANGAMAEMDVSGRKICVALSGGTLYACATKCPHAGGNLSAGYIDALGNVVCPLHRYKFSLKNGRNTSGEGYFLKTYPIEIRPDGVFIGLEENGLLNWFK